LESILNKFEGKDTNLEIYSSGFYVDPVPDTFRKKLKSCKRMKFITQFSFVSHEFSLYLLCYLNKEIRL